MSPEIRSDPERRAVLGGVLLLAIAGLVAWSNSFEGVYLFDDATDLVGNPHVRSLWPLARAMTGPEHSGLVGRPLASLSFALTYALGDGEPWGHHLGNLVVHVLVAVTLFGLLRLVLGGSILGQRVGSSATGLALSIALLWEVHPLQTGAITYIVQRIEAMMALFLLLPMYCAVRSFRSDRPGRWQVAAVLACAAGMATKEVMVGAPLLVLLYDSRFVAGSARAALARRTGLYLGLAATLLVLFAMVSLSGGRAASVGLGYGEYTTLYYLQVQATALVQYVRLVFWPSPLVFDYGKHVVPLMPWLPAGLAVLGALAGTFVLLLRASPAKRLLGFCGAWFFVILAPTSSVLPIATVPITEYRMYLPLVGVLGPVVVGAFGLLQRARLVDPWRPVIAGSLVGVAALALVAVTRDRNEDYHSRIGMWADVVSKVPGNDRAQDTLGAALREADRLAEGLPHYQEAVRLAPEDPAWRVNLGSAYVDLGQVDEGIAQYERALALKPEFPPALTNLGGAHLRKGNLIKAADYYERALRHQFVGRVVIHREYARLLEELGQRAEAARHYQAAINLEPGHLETILSLAWLRVLAPENDVRDGAEALRVAGWLGALLGSDDLRVLDLMAAAYAELGSFESAVSTAQRGEDIARSSGDEPMAWLLNERAALYASSRTLAAP